jgi:type IV pilus assembly protein PilB
MDNANLVRVLEQGTQVSIIELVDVLLAEAVLRRSSDIHLDPAEHGVRVRFRIDGELEDVVAIDSMHHAALISRIKVLSQLRTDEHWACQDGRFRSVINGPPIDVRVAISPAYYGERAVLRLLTQAYALTDLATLGMTDRDRARVEAVVHRPHGMVLASGPTGSGKTTTLYTLLRLVHTPTTSVVTIEDPIEYAIAGTNQMQVNSKTQLTFASGLRSMLRQDPDIIMVGEIRDSETARLAVNTALTGHLLLSTIHTNDAATTLLRLLDLGVEGYLVASTVNVVIAQRLVRTICKQCKQNQTVHVAALPAVLRQYMKAPSEQSVPVYAGRGCDVCRATGYSGRVALFEVLSITPAIRALIYRKTPAAEITRLATEQGMTSLAEDGWKKVLAGITTVEELTRVLSE